MIDWTENLLQVVTGNPFLQAVLAALATFVMEDPTTITCGLLVADNQMAFVTAFCGLAGGIILGDFGLYLLGRFAQPWVMSRSWINTDKINKSQGWFNRNIILAIMGSRFLPGTRLPAYLTAGILKISALKFLAVAIAASVIWTGLLLILTMRFGEAVITGLDHWKWPAAIVIILLIIFIQWMIRSRQSKTRAGHSHRPLKSAFEFWPPALFYLPVGLYYLWLAIRYRGLTLPTVSNPSIYSGGMIGESKSQIFNLVPEKYFSTIARWTGFVVSNSGTPLALIQKQADRYRAEASLEFPVVCKPDIGQRGHGVRRINTQSALHDYLQEFPRGQKLILQELIDYPHEAGIFYYRYPAQARGRIFSITLKEFPKIIGDGKSSIRELILADPRARLIKKIYFRRHHEVLDKVLNTEQEFPLVFPGNHCQGAVFRNGFDYLTPELQTRIDELGCALPDFYFGRFDVRFKSYEDLQRGKGFKIVEINGASSEATHIWDSRTKLFEAYATLFRQFKILFEISGQNRRRGHQPLKLRQFIADLQHYRRQAQKYPNSN